jgi:hypothetical protein
VRSAAQLAEVTLPEGGGRYSKKEKTTPCKVRWSFLNFRNVEAVWRPKMTIEEAKPAGGKPKYEPTAEEKIALD